jgi:hypothetical protein
LPQLITGGSNINGVWALQNEGFNNGSTVLRAYDVTDLSKVYNTVQNANRDDPSRAVKFTVPTIANGKVYVPAVKKLSVYGLLGESKTCYWRGAK